MAGSTGCQPLPLALDLDPADTAPYTRSGSGPEFAAALRCAEMERDGASYCLDAPPHSAPASPRHHPRCPVEWVAALPGAPRTALGPAIGIGPARAGSALDPTQLAPTVLSEG